jgi:hypothetical protein
MKGSFIAPAVMKDPFITGGPTFVGIGSRVV